MTSKEVGNKQLLEQAMEENAILKSSLIEV